MTGSSDEPLFLDFTPPIPGLVWDGLARRVQTKYTSSNLTLSANWADFKDPESGVLLYREQHPFTFFVHFHMFHELPDPFSL